MTQTAQINIIPFGPHNSPVKEGGQVLWSHFRDVETEAEWSASSQIPKMWCQPQWDRMPFPMTQRDRYIHAMCWTSGFPAQIPMLKPWSPVWWYSSEGYCGGLTRFRWSHRVGVPVMGLVSLQEEEEIRALSPPGENTARRRPSANQRRDLTKNQTMPAPWTSQPPELCQINVCYLSHQVCVILLQYSKTTETCFWLNEWKPN